MTSLHVICSLPQIKNPGYAYGMVTLFCKSTGTVPRYAISICLLNVLCATCVNEDSSDRARRAHSLGYSQLIITQ